MQTIFIGVAIVLLSIVVAFIVNLFTNYPLINSLFTNHWKEVVVIFIFCVIALVGLTIIDRKPQVATVSTVVPLPTQSALVNSPCPIGVSAINLSEAVIPVNQSVEANIMVDNSTGKALLYDWKTDSGSMKPGLRTPSPQSIYTAPNIPGDYTVTVVTTALGCENIVRTATIRVISAGTVASAPPQLTIAPSATDTATLVAVTSIPSAQPTAPITADAIFRPKFLFGEPGGFQSRNGLEPSFRRIKTENNHVSYNFTYNLPQGEAGQDSGFVLQTAEPADVSAYKYIRVVLTLKDPEATCEVILKDAKSILRYAKINKDISNNEFIITPEGDTYTVLILLSGTHFSEIDPHSIIQVGFKANSDYTSGRHSIIIEDVGFSNGD